MRLKSFEAKTMTDAMRQIKEALGDEAIIVSTKEAGGWIRVTAAVEQEDLPAPAKQKSLSRATPAYDEEEMIAMITDALLKHRVPGVVSEKITAAAMSLPADEPRQMLAQALGKIFKFDHSPKKTNKPMILVGPPGAGKTLMAAKLAAAAVMEGKRPAVVTTDIARAGGVEQLSAFLNIMKLPLHQAEDAKTLAAALSKVKSATSVIIDTGGLNPFDPAEMKTLLKLISVEEMDAAFVLPAGFDAEESAEMAMTFDIIGVKRLIPTRLDFARRIGGILSAADKGGLSFSTASHTPQVANGILALTPEKLAEYLMPVIPGEKAKKGKT
ncbi:MAG TPA: ATP-binding protein [Patescibacteria group bacterium]|nr:ATP-binding protein [Patescibacteria group bacterium]